MSMMDNMQSRLLDGRYLNIRIWIAVLFLVVGLSIFQDFLFSQLRNTGFYISESLLYNTIWVFILPFALLKLKALDKVNFSNKLIELFYRIILTAVITLLHIVVFTSFFVLVSYLVWSPSHRFVAIFRSAISSEFSILFIVYLCLPYVLKLVNKNRSKKELNINQPKTIKLKKDGKILSFEMANIQRITSDKPYTLVIVDDLKYLDNRTLRDFESLLDHSLFARVNKGTIINKNLIREVSSRGNGDYDAKMNSGDLIRLSRHYRSNWGSLLQ